MYVPIYRKIFTRYLNPSNIQNRIVFRRWKATIF